MENNMFEKFKKMPPGAKLAIAFLALLYVLMCVTAPPVAAGFTIMGLIYWAIDRVLTYFVFGK
jgi:hypothetical protein